MTITIIGTIVILILFFYIVKSTVTARKKAYVGMLNKTDTAFLAIAGSNDDATVSATTNIQAVESNAFKDKDGNYLNANDYKHLVVHGSSMRFCGINDHDMIFVDTNFNVEISSEFPCVLVLRRSISNDDSPKYKIRRTWTKTTYTSKDALIMEIKALMSSPLFQSIRQLEVYDGDDNVISDLISNRIPAYEESYVNCGNANCYDRNIIVSTTFHTKEGRVRFSIHPISLIEGKVVASFAM